MSFSKKKSEIVIDIYHNILWSKYKGGVFSALFQLYSKSPLIYRFTQIAESSGQRLGLSSVDQSYHNYPYKLIFKGSYDSVPKYKRIIKLFCLVFLSKADMVILPGNYEAEYWAMLLACILRRKIRAVFSDSTGVDNPSIGWKRFFKKLFFSMCDGVFGYGLRSKEYVISFGVPEEKFYRRLQAAALPHEYNQKSIVGLKVAALAQSKTFNFLYVGRLSSEKGIDTLLEAFGQIIVRMPHAYLVLVGSGPLRDSLCAQADRMGISNSVRFVGAMELSSLADYYLSAHVFVLPSISEPWGLVANEAMSYGCPIVVSNNCGCVPELIDEGVTGLSFPAGDVPELVSRLVMATVKFSDVEATASLCLKKISSFSPQLAAEQIDYGCKDILRRNGFSI